MKILLAIDGSEQSSEAIQALGSLAPAEQLIIFHAVNLPRLSYPTLGPNLDKELALTVVQAMQEEGERLLDQVASLLPPHHGATSKYLESGYPADRILSKADELDVNLIVIGARGLGKIRETVFGSVSHRVLTHAHCPTLIVKAPLRHAQHILLPIEGEEDASAALGFLKKHPFREQPHVTVIHVVPFFEPAWPIGAMIPESFRKEMMDHAKSLTSQVASQLQTLGYQADGKATMGTPSASIVQESNTNTIDLILMRSKNRTEVSRFLLGSVSHAVVHHASCSVLLVREASRARNCQPDTFPLMSTWLWMPTFS